MTDYGHDLRFGTFLTPHSSRPAVVVDLAVTTDRAGLDLVTFQDHPYQPTFLDAWTLLSFVAARTDRVHLAGNVLNLPLRTPSVLARSAASLDLLSSGRCALALGAGAFWEAVAAMGGPRRTPGEAITALEEAVDIIREMWDPQGRRSVRVDGAHYRVVGAKPGPASTHTIPIWLGVLKPRGLDLLGRKADGWLPSLSYLEPGDLQRGNARIDESAAAAGRHPRDIRRLMNVGLGADGVAGLPQSQLIERLTALALDDGVGTFILAAEDARSIEVWGGEVAPAVRAAVAAER